MKNAIPQETQKEEEQYIDIPLDELEAIDVSEQHLEKMAKGYFLGKTAVGRRQDVRKVLEDKVVGKIGKKGKYLTDKLFELVEGVYILDSIKEKANKKGEEIRYYKVPPNLQAIIYCIDRVLGKPKQMTVQANFSLSKLLIEDNTDGKLRQGNNAALQARPDIFHSSDVEDVTDSSQESI